MFLDGTDGGVKIFKGRGESFDLFFQCRVACLKGFQPDSGRGVLKLVSALEFHFRLQHISRFALKLVIPGLKFGDDLLQFDRVEDVGLQKLAGEGHEFFVCGLKSMVGLCQFLHPALFFGAECQAGQCCPGGPLALSGLLDHSVLMLDGLPAQVRVEQCPMGDFRSGYGVLKIHEALNDGDTGPTQLVDEP